MKKSECEMTPEACGMEKCCFRVISSDFFFFFWILTAVSCVLILLLLLLKEKLFYKGTLSTKCINMTAEKTI